MFLIMTDKMNSFAFVRLISGTSRESFEDDNLHENSFLAGRKLFQATEYYWNDISYHPQSYEDNHDYPSLILYSAAACFMVLALSGIFGNLVAFDALTKDNKLRYFTSTLIINLALVDFFISSIHNSIVYLVLIADKGYYSSLNCKALVYVKYTGSMICMFIITAIVCNRFIFIVYPQKYSTLFTEKKILMVIVAIWFFPVMLLALPLCEVGGKFAYNVETGRCDLQDGMITKELSFFLIFNTCPLVVICCYLAMCFVLIARRKEWTYCRCLESFNITEEENDRNSNEIQDPCHEGKEVRLLLFMFLIFTVTILCYIPLFYIKTVRNREDYYRMHTICYVPYFFASTVKPAIYYAMSEKYRAKFKGVLTRKARL